MIFLANRMFTQDNKNVAANDATYAATWRARHDTASFLIAKSEEKTPATQPCGLCKCTTFKSCTRCVQKKTPPPFGGVVFLWRARHDLNVRPSESEWRTNMSENLSKLGKNAEIQGFSSQLEMFNTCQSVQVPAAITI